MIYNQHLDRLVEVRVVQDFMQRHNFQGVLCSRGDIHGFILYRYPYVVGFWDALIDNYLDHHLADLESDLFINDGAIYGCSVALGFHDRVQVKNRSYKDHSQNEIFSSFHAEKMLDLQVGLEAIDKLLPLIEAKGGLSSMRNGTFDPRFNFKDSVQPMYHGLKEKYLKCINNEA